MESLYDVIIIGGGPAGLAAALYTSRAKLRTLIIEKEKPGGELMDRDMIENYPSYPDGISGPDLGSKMLEQVLNFGTEIQFGEVTKIETWGNHKTIRTPDEDYFSKATILAGGARPKKLGVPGEQRFAGKGVFYCATCDGPAFANKIVAVAGGGDSGITEAFFLARIVSKAIVIELLPQLCATKVLQERLSSHPNIEVKCGVKIEEIRGDERVKALAFVDTETGQSGLVEVDGVLVHVGLEPETDYLKGTLPLNDKGQVLVNERMETEISGIFAAGDIRHNSPMQIVTAVGDGATAALSLIKYLGSF